MGKLDYNIQALYNSRQVNPAGGNWITSKSKQARLSRQIQDGHGNAGI
jgi:hypothetical protein